MKLETPSTTANRAMFEVISFIALVAARQKFKLYTAVIINALRFKSFMNFSKHQKQHFKQQIKYLAILLFSA